MDEDSRMPDEPALRTDHELPATLEDNKPPAPAPAAPLPEQPAVTVSPPVSDPAPTLQPPAPTVSSPMSPPVAVPTAGYQNPQPAHTNNAGTIILQWLTYAFWGWTVFILSLLTYTVFTDFLDQGDSSSFNYYIISAALVLLPISLVCDYLYSKKEPQKKVGGASIVMVIHAVLFALFGIGSLIWGVFSVVSLLTSSGSDSHASTLAGLYSSIIIVGFYGATFARTLNPPKLPWIPKAYKVFMLALVGIFIVLGFLGAHHNEDKQPAYTSSDYSSSSSSNSSKSYNYPDKEEVNKQGQRRPVQYVHICDTSDSNIEYVSQGKPECLGDDIFQSDYDPSVAGTVFSSPCKTNSGKLRYVYISNDETCPPGTTLLFYNSLGGSTSGPSNVITD